MISPASLALNAINFALLYTSADELFFGTLCPWLSRDPLKLNFVRAASEANEVLTEKTSVRAAIKIEGCSGAVLRSPNRPLFFFFSFLINGLATQGGVLVTSIGVPRAACV